MQDLEEAICAGIVLMVGGGYRVGNLLQTVHCLEDDDFVKRVVQFQAIVGELYFLRQRCGRRIWV